MKIPRITVYVLLFWFAGYIIFDAISTSFLLSNAGVSGETNPVVTNVMNFNGVYGVFLVKGLACLGILFIVSKTHQSVAQFRPRLDGVMCAVLTLVSGTVVSLNAVSILSFLTRLQPSTANSLIALLFGLSGVVSFKIYRISAAEYRQLKESAGAPYELSANPQPSGMGQRTA